MADILSQSRIDKVIYFKKIFKDKVLNGYIYICWYGIELHFLIVT